MKKEKKKTSVSVAGMKEQQTKNGVVGSGKPTIKVELYERDDSSTINNDDVAKRIGNYLFDAGLKSLNKGGFSFDSPDEINRFVCAVYVDSFPNHPDAWFFNSCLKVLVCTCSALCIKINITLKEPYNGIKQVYASPFTYKIVTEACYDQLEGYNFTDEIEAFVSTEDSNLYEINNKVLRSIAINDHGDVIHEVLDRSKEPDKLVEWLKEFMP